MNAVMLIYVNLIMDILGALALASTRPQADIAHERFSPQSRIMTPQMYRQIFLVSAYMVAIMGVIIHSGKKIFELDYTTHDQIVDNKDKRMHFTLIFNTFIFLQVFNLINCRDVGRTKWHGFTGLFKNALTCFVLLAIIGFQFIACFTNITYTLLETRKIGEGRYWAISIVAAASVIIANTLFKLIPNSWIDKRMPSLDESKSIGSNNRLMAAYDK